MKISQKAQTVKNHIPVRKICITRSRTKFTGIAFSCCAIFSIEQGWILCNCINEKDGEKTEATQDCIFAQILSNMIVESDSLFNVHRKSDVNDNVGLIIGHCVLY